MKRAPILFLFPLLALLSVACQPGSRGSRTFIQNKGSDTLVNVAQTWAERYKEVRPDTPIAVSGGGSGTGISALINGTADIANSSRRLRPKERQLIEKSGVQPVEFVVGYDALAVYLHPNNPLETLTIQQLAEIYGEGGSLENWTDLGVEVPGCPSNEIIRVSRQNNSGTYVYFRNAVLGNDRDYKLGSRDLHGSKDVVDLVANTPCAIGYSGLAYDTPRVKKACVSVKGDMCVEPSTDTAISGEYPIARPLFMYTRGEPDGEVDAYLDWILSDAGQCIIQKKGYAPVRKIECNGASAT